MRKLLAIAYSLLVLASPSGAEAADRWTELPTPPAMPEAVESGKAPVNGIEMYYAVYGTAKDTPILMIHGGLGYADIWANQVADLAKDHRVIVADSRGHGRSTRTDAPYGYDLMASDYLALLDYLKVDKVALVGWSDGGIIGLDIAMKHPERLTRLFAQAANTKTSGVKADVLENKTFLAYIDRCGEVYKKISPTPDQYDAFVNQIGQMWASEPNWTDDQLKTIKTPTAIVLGDHDEAVDRGHTEYIAKTVPGAELVILKDVSHFAMLQDPAGYTAAVRAFLDKP
ncbi:alpha/beta fold hydrolase [Oryzibacter oryziterrae]|uniref:alpha/beta fold hydrolase n=1 Tax=Oryzibacter oryziterrae TaxID=2766474 RepID=UPI001F1BAE1A|nr:alpha/beta hydrolase [Oryzibacter oryziterrae]